MERGWWDESDSGISFNDEKPRHDTSLKVHHFRSSNIKKELNALENSWNMCLINPELIPAQKIKCPESSKIDQLNNIEFLNVEIMQVLPEEEKLDIPTCSSVLPKFIPKIKCKTICHSENSSQESVLENDVYANNNDNDIDEFIFIYEFYIFILFLLVNYIVL